MNIYIITFWNIFLKDMKKKMNLNVNFAGTCLSDLYWLLFSLVQGLVDSYEVV